MEVEAKKVIWSEYIETDLEDIFLWGEETFGITAADQYADYILEQIQQLGRWYLMHPQCRQMPTRNKIYRNIITRSHRIIYRVLTDRVEVLRIFHLKSSNTRIRSARTVKLTE